MIRDLLTDAPEARDAGRSPCRRRSAPAGFARGGPGGPRPGPREGARPGRPGRARPRERRRPRLRRRRRVPRSSTSRCSTRERARLRRADPPRRAARRAAPRRAAGALHGTSSSTSTRTPTRARSRCSRRSPATAATWSSSATPTSRSTGSAAPTSAASSTSRPRSRPSTAARAVVALRTTRRFGSRLLAAPRGGRRRASAPRRHRARRLGVRSATPEAAPDRVGHGQVEVLTSTPPAPRPSTSPTCCGGPTSRTACAGPRWRCWCARARSSIPALRRALAAAGVPVEVAGDDTPLVREPAVHAAARRAAGAWSTLDRDDPHRPALRRRRPGRGAAGLTARRPRRRPTCAGWPARCARREKTRAEEAGERPLSSPRAAPPLVLDPGLLDDVARQPTAAPARRLADLLAPGARAARRGRHRRRGALGALGRHRWPPAAARAPTPVGGHAARLAHRDLDAICALFEVAARAEEQRGHTSVAELPRRADGAADPGRHPGRPRGARRRRTAADRPPGQGPGVAAGRRRPRPGGRLARPAAARLAAAGRPHRPRRPAPAGHRGRDAGRGAAAVLRRLHPGPRAARGHRRGVARRRRRPAVALRRTSSAARCSTGSGSAARARCRCAGLVGRAATTVADPDKPEAAPPRRRPRGSPGSMTTEVHGRPVAPQADPAHLVGDCAASTESDRSRCAPARAAARSRRARSRRCSTARRSGSSSARPAASGSAPQPGLRHRRARARRPARVAATLSPGDDLMALRRRGLGPARLPHPVVPRPRARGGRGGDRPVRAWHAGDRDAGSCSRPSTRSTPRSRCPTARWCGSHGYVDRLEIDADGRSGSSTSRPASTPRRQRSRSTPSSGSTSSPSSSGAADELVGSPAEPGGAELVQLRIGDGRCPRCRRSRRRRRRRRRARRRGAADGGAQRRARRGAGRPARAHACCQRCAFAADLPGAAPLGSVLGVTPVRDRHPEQLARADARRLHVQRPAVRRDHRAAGARLS